MKEFGPDFLETVLNQLGVKPEQAIVYLPGNNIVEGTHYHVCQTAPIINATNIQTKCVRCGATIFYGNDSGDLKSAEKLCHGCATKMTAKGGAYCYGNGATIKRDKLRLQQGN